MSRRILEQRKNKPTLDVTHIPGMLLAERQSWAENDERSNTYSCGIAILDLLDIGASANLADEKCARLVLWSTGGSYVEVAGANLGFKTAAALGAHVSDVERNVLACKSSATKDGRGQRTSRRANMSKNNK